MGLPFPFPTEANLQAQMAAMRKPLARDFKYSFLPHKSCSQRLAAKCNWEAMAVLAVLRGYRDIVCRTCYARARAKFPQLPRRGP